MAPPGDSRARHQSGAVRGLLVASQLPELVEKSLAWQGGLLSSGRALAHLVVVAAPLALAVLGLVRRRNRPPLSVAVAGGVLSQLATDAVPLSPGGSTRLDSVLWPVVIYESSVDAAAADSGTAAHTGDILIGASPSLVAGAPTLEVGVRLGLVGLAGCVWLADGGPGSRELRVAGRWPVATVQSWRRRCVRGRSGSRIRTRKRALRTYV